MGREVGYCTRPHSQDKHVLLAIRDGGSRLDESTDHSLNPAPPAPRGGTEGLGHNRTVLVEKDPETFTANQGRCLGGTERGGWGGRKI